MPLNNENNNECCKCTTPEYEIILNQQGPQGRQGNEGKPGFSPQITVVADTYSVYQLNITTEEGQITTPNLKANIPLGGSEGMVLTKNSSIDGDASFNPLPNASTENAGIVELATITDTQPDEEGEVDDTKAVTPNVLIEYVDNKLTTELSNLVTLDTEQTITGSKTFDNSVTLSTTNFSSQTNLLIPNQNNYNGGFQVWDLANEGKFNPQLINANAEKDSGEYPGFGFLGNNPENIQITDNKYKNAFGVDLYGQSSHPLITIKNGVLGDIIDSNDIATTSKAGIVKPDGTTITIDVDGTLHGVESYSLPVATSTTLGGIKVGENLSITEDGILSATGGVTEIPQANATTLGGIKANEKQDIDTQEVRIDTTTGLLYTQPGSVPDIIDGGNANTTSVIPQPIDNYSSNDAIVNNGYTTTDVVTVEDVQ